ncbi:MAG: peptidoglycan editing factor PgeF [Hyphomicrobiales bacterium]|nr:peptidoglycan editing factor PgeF [Hyphomicrobiales bacterium]
MTDAPLHPLHPPFLAAANLARPGARHAFFTRRGGVSEGVYGSLNGGVGSRDEPAAVAQNRARMAAALGVAAESLLVPYQVHSTDALAVSAPWRPDARPRCDGLATATPGLALGVTGADCGILLFHDPRAGVIAAAHAGWRGALGGAVEATLRAMEGLGARAGDVHVALGPMIARKSYEVDAAFRARFLEADSSAADLFDDGARPERYQFDLPDFILRRLERAGVASATNLGRDTYAEPDEFFSFRRATHRGEADYGRLVAAIALE